MLRADTLKTLATVATSTIATQLFRKGIRGAFFTGLAPIGGGARFAGEAFTLRTIPIREDIGTPDYMVRFPDNLQRKAMVSVGAGQVLVCDCRGDRRAGIFGGILAASLRARGVAGVVVDGAVRDPDEVGASGLPVVGLGGASPGSQAFLEVVDLDVPVACAGVPVFPGDVIVGDAAGAICIPRHLADEIAEAAPEVERMENWLKRQIEAGAPLQGTYPPGPEMRAAYEAWRKTQG